MNEFKFNPEKFRKEMEMIKGRKIIKIESEIKELEGILKKYKKEIKK